MRWILFTSLPGPLWLWAMDPLFPTCWSFDNRRMQNVEIVKEFHYHQGKCSILFLFKWFKVGLYESNENFNRAFFVLLETYFFHNCRIWFEFELFFFTGSFAEEHSQTDKIRIFASFLEFHPRLQYECREGGRTNRKAIQCKFTKIVYSFGVRWIPVEWINVSDNEY